MKTAIWGLQFEDPLQERSNVSLGLTAQQIA